MKALVLAALALISTPALAQQQGVPFKLIIAWGNGQTPPLVIDYPTQTRCEAAVQAVERAAAEREARAMRNRTPGAIAVTGPVVIYAICIPG